MGEVIPRQRPAVVLRSRYTHLRVLLAIAMIAVVGLAAAVVILATNDGGDTSVGSATLASAPGPESSTRYDGGPEEGSRGALPAPPPSTRYDGGPEEGTRGESSTAARSTAAADTRYDGGPEEGSRGSGH